MEPSSPPFELRRGGFLGGLTPADFLKHYWQKRPVLIRKALPGFSTPISPDELAGLACEAEVESRLILEKDGPTPWHVEHGPIPEERFSELPETHWTLLVQECNKLVPELAELLERFDFIPQWRVDDVMVSYAPEFGTVGPHTDQYDVFLIQGLGTRRWQISTKPVAKSNFLPNLDLRIMKEFIATQEWIVEPGDMLYLPPGIAHYGVALEDCITLSVGFRAPSHLEIITGFMDEVASRLDTGQRYSDADLTLQQHSAEINATALAKVRSVLHSVLNNDKALESWFGKYVTEAKSGTGIETYVELPDPKIKPEAFISMFKHSGVLERSPCARFAFIQHPQDISLFVDGHHITLSAELSPAIAKLCDQRRYSFEELESYLSIPGFVAVLCDLYNAGYLSLEETGISIKPVSWREAEPQLRALRTMVFINEQNVPTDLEWDGKDEDCTHLLARNENGQPIGTVRLLADGHIGRMAVLREWRGKGVGTALLQAILNIAKKRGLEKVKLDAQTHAVKFYERHGFVADDKVFMDAGIPHQHMTLDLTHKPSKETVTDMTDEPLHKLGEASDILYLSTREEHRNIALDMVKQARRSLHLFTYNLDPSLYDTEEFIEAVKQLAIASTNTKVYILVKDPKDVIQRGHRIVELARRISSHVFIHRAAEEDLDRIDTFMVVDEAGIMRRPHAERYEGTANYYAPGEARQYLKYFHEAWERSQPETELKRLHI